MSRQNLRIKRVYEPPDTADGVRVLVDRLWPRGLSRKRAKIDLWLKEIAPSDAPTPPVPWGSLGLGPLQDRLLRRTEEAPAQSALDALLDRLSRGPITLLFAARDETRNNAVALKEWFEDRGR